MGPYRPYPERPAANPWVVLGILLFVAVLGAGVFWGLSRRGLGLSMLSGTGSRAVGGRGLTSAPAVDARQFEQRLTAAGATTGGELEVSLAWDTLSDLDLAVREPSGQVIHGYHAISPSGGQLDVDANPTLVNEEGERRVSAGLPPGAQNLLPLPEALVDLDEKVARLRERSGEPGLPGLFPGLPDLGRMPGRADRSSTPGSRRAG